MSAFQVRNIYVTWCTVASQQIGLWGLTMRESLIRRFPVGIGLTLIIGLFLAAAPAFAASCPTAPYVHFFDAGQPPNIGELKLQILDYKCFGGYDRDVAKVLAEARVYIETRRRCY
jgi:hypothetical protein